MDRVKSGLKTASPYVVTASVTALQLLQTVSALSGCAPSVSIVAGVALQTIQMAQAADQNKESCQEIAERISEIMIVLLTPFATEATKEVPPEMDASIKRLTRDIEDIQLFLDRLQRKNFIKQMFFANRYANQISGFYGKLDWAITVFKVNAHINEALSQLEMGNKIREIHSVVQRLSLPAPSVAQSGSTALITIPPKPEIFYGREEIVEDIVRRMNQISNTRFAILGPGGLGKTSVALAVLQDERTKENFGDHRYWVACVQASSSSTLTGLLAKSLKLPESGSNPFEQVLAHLKGDDKAKVILLDNFETPWDMEDERADIEHILCCLASIPQVSVLITMRSDQPPSNRLEWTRPLLPYLTVLSPGVARKLYLHIDPLAEEDPALDELLEALSYMPLAVMLMAKRGPRGETPTQLLARWQTVGTKMLHQGSSSAHSVRVSVRVSIESNTMKTNPDALVLLSILSQLPSGAPLDLLPRIAPSIDTAEATFTLLQVSLAYLGANRKSIHVLSPIQHYVEEFHPPTDEQWKDLFEAYRGLLLEGGSRRNDRRTVRSAQGIAKHVINLEAILKKAFTRPNPELAIETSVILGWHQYFAVRHLVFLDRVLKEAEKTGRHDLIWNTKHCIADTKRTEGRNEAFEMLKEVLPELRKIGNEENIASCLWSLGGLYYNEQDREQAKAVLNESKAIAEKLGEIVTHGECLELLAEIDYRDGDEEEAMRKLETAYKMFSEMKPAPEPIGMIETLFAMSDKLVDQEKFDEAREKLNIAKDVIQTLVGWEWHEGWRQNNLGDLEAAQGNWEEAKAAYDEGRKLSQKSGQIYTAALCLLRTADVLKQQGFFEDARDKARAAMAVSQELKDKDFSGYCMAELEEIDQWENAPEDDDDDEGEDEEESEEGGEEPSSNSGDDDEDGGDVPVLGSPATESVSPDEVKPL